MRVLVSTVVFGFAVLCLMWFVAAIASVLRDAGRGGWATAATLAGAAVGAVYLTLMTLRASLAHPIAGSGSDEVTAALNDIAWVLTSTVWFPIAMLVMAGSFGLWRAGIFSTRAFEAGVTAITVVSLFLVRRRRPLSPAKSTRESP